MRILIAGGGVAGLATAARLSEAGVDLVVVERQGPAGPAGSGLSLFPNGLRALDALGLGAVVRERCGDQAPRGRSGLRTPGGRRVLPMAKAFTAGVRAVDRGELHAALTACVPREVLSYGTAVEAVHGTRVGLSDGSEIDGVDLVVGADGLRSAVRRSVWGPDDPGTRRAGYFACRGITDLPVPVDIGGETWGRGRRFGIAPLADGRVYWFAVGHGDPPELDDGHRWAAEEFAAWHRPIPDLVAATDPATVGVLPIVELARPLSTYVRGRVALVGDAAHAMTPNLGQGANQALEDAADLCLRLEPVFEGGGPGALAGALEAYDRARRRPSQRVARASRLVGRVASAVR